MHYIRYAVFRESDDLLYKCHRAMALALMQYELLLPYNLLHADLRI